MNKIQISKEYYKITPLQKEMILSYLSPNERNNINWRDYFIFKIILCNNEIDRDNEKFSIPVLFQIRDMAIGKTGILENDCDINGRNSVARIFDCSVEYDRDSVTKDGEPLLYVQAHAFIDTNASNNNYSIVSKIKEGFYDEISVGCSIFKSHKTLDKSNGVINSAITVIDSISDLYEWAIVQKPKIKNCPLKDNDGKCRIEHKMCYCISEQQCNKLQSAYFIGLGDK